LIIGKHYTLNYEDVKELSYLMKYKYNGNNNLILKSKRGPDDIIFKKIKYKYDSKNNLIKEYIEDYNIKLLDGYVTEDLELILKDYIYTYNYYDKENYYENGQIRKKQFDRDKWGRKNTKTEVSYYENGNMKERKSLLLDSRRHNTIYSYYYENGKIKVTGSYFRSSSKKDKKWSYYDQKGNILKIETWKNGKLKRTKEY